MRKNNDINPIVVAVIAMVAGFIFTNYGSNSKPNVSYAKTVEVENDISFYHENGTSNSGIATGVVIDKATGVHYVVVYSTFGGSAMSITPRLTSEGEIYTQGGN